MKTFESAEDVLEYAIDEENKSHDFYRKLAELTNNEKSKALLEDLAFQEDLHAKKLEAFREGKIHIAAEKIQGLGIAEVVDARPFSPDMEYIELLKFAMHKERNSFRMYWFMAENTEDKEMAAIFSKLATEEAYHKLRLEIEYDLAIF